MDVNDLERVALCALNDIFGFEPQIAHRLLARAGCALELLELGDKLIDEICGPYSKYKGILGNHLIGTYQKELDKIYGEGAYFLTISDEHYPMELKECKDAPVGLYVKSASPPSGIFGQRAHISVVGTRDISPYGKDWCQRLVSEMASCQNPPMIVSGMALGTDITAHCAALENGIPTVAVLPCGIDDVYPKVHQCWVDRIARTPGCAILTDYPTGTVPKAINFLRRNRIIAGLSSVTVLIESKVKGGGLITAEFAFEYDRDVYALPGRIDDIRSQGCNRLIRNKIAEPIDDIPHFIKNLGLGKWNRPGTSSMEDGLRRRYAHRTDGWEMEDLIRFARYVRSNRACTPEDITEGTGLDFRTVSYFKGLLESDGILVCDLLQRCSIKLKNV